MLNEIYISEVSLRVPGVSDYAAYACQESNVSGADFSSDALNGQKSCFGKINLEADHNYMPEKQDIKTMRTDVLASTICAIELKNKISLTGEEIQDTPLYFASGVFIEQMLRSNDAISRKLKEYQKRNEIEKFRSTLFRIIPPLIVLNTLTNAAACYAAQYTGFAGSNASLGNTSLSGSQALYLARNKIAAGKDNYAVAGASNLGGIYSYLTFSAYVPGGNLWRESEGASIFFISGKEYLEKNKLNPLCRIINISFSSSPPSLEGMPHSLDLTLLKDIDREALIIYSGAFTDSSDKLMQDSLAGQFKNTRGTFDSFGNMGPVNVFNNILTGLHTQHARNGESFYSFDIDPFGRQALIEIKLK